MSVIWGIPYLLIKVADSGVSPPVLVLARVTVGAAVLLPIAARKRQLAVLRPHWRWLAAFALVEIIIPWLLLSEAETRLPSSLSGLLIACVPILIAVLGMLTGGTDRLTLARWMGLLLGLAGVAVLVGPGAPAGDAGSIAMVLGVALCYATGPLIASRKLSTLPSIGMTGVCLAFAAVVCAPLAALSWPAAVPSAKVLASLAGLGVVCTALAFLLFFALISDAGPARATVITYINPAVAVTLGVLLLGEQLTLLMVVAFVAILGGSVLAARPGQRTAPSASADTAPDGAVAASRDGGPAGERALLGDAVPGEAEVALAEAGQPGWAADGAAGQARCRGAEPPSENPDVAPRSSH
jgi:drug/metabolite transporter (DMT)-like permease